LNDSAEGDKLNALLSQAYELGKSLARDEIK
jgi:hypothetical protein